MIEEVSYRLGYNKTLKHNSITLIWNMCRFEQSWHVDKLSAWCAVSVFLFFSYFFYEKF